MKLRPRIVSALLLLAACSGGQTPPVIISEFMAENNGSIRDSFGLSSDWVELQNTTGNPICLENWSLTDNLSKPAKWRFPNVTLPPWGTLLVWASDRTLSDPAGELHTGFALSKSGEYLGLYDSSGALVHDFRPTFPAQYENIAYGVSLAFVTNGSVLVSNASPVRAFCPADDALGSTWRLQTFEDSGWTNGLLPTGYGTKNPAWISEVNLSLQSIGLGKPGVYLRIPFNLEAAAAVESLTLEATYDDGAAVFLNGAFACGMNAPAYGTLTRTSYASSILGDPSALPAADVTASTNALLDGTNVMAVHLLNCNDSSSDLFFKPSLSAVVKRLVVGEPTYLTAATPGTRNGGETTQRLPQTVVFSEPSGICAAPFTLTLSGNLAGQTIRYTTNGAEPCATNGTLYTVPFPVSASAHLRARVFDAVGRSGTTSTAHYTFTATDAATLAFSTALPILVLRETDPSTSGIPTLESTNDVACSVHYFEPVGGSACLTSAPALTARAAIHVRGSSSSSFPKKPYTLTFWGEDNDDKRVDLVGFPKGSDFALISCYNFDRTYMHDALLFDLARQTGRYAPRTRWVELFLIGNETNDLSAAHYAGLYVLEERIKADADRVPIDEVVSPASTALPDVTGSYLFKADRVDLDEFSWRTAHGYPASSGERSMALASPKAALLQPQQSRYIIDAFNAFENAAFGSAPMNPTNGVSRFSDVLSFADFHLFKMFSMDVDIFTLSSWFHKDRGGKIMAGPLWDFDRSLGPYGYSEASYPNVKRWDAWTFAAEPFIRGDFWGKLHAQPAFQRLYWDRWFELRGSALSASNFVATITRLKAQIPEAAAERDFVKWGQRPNQQFGTTHASEVQWLTWFVTNHAAWIDQNLYAKASSLLKPATLSPGSCARPAGAWLRVTLSAPEGDQIRYTLDGTDPALWNNTASPAARSCVSGSVITLSTSALLFARAYSTTSGRWGLAARAEYLIGARYAQPGDLLLSEVHYHPELDAADDARLPELTSGAYEFVELLNVSDREVCLTGCRFPEGQPADALTLGPALLKPGEHAVVARDREAFASRYGASASPLAYWCYGGLSDSGETVTLLDRNGLTLDTLTYKTSGSWPKRADGKGDSLNRAAFSRVDGRLPWDAAIPTPGRAGFREWLGLRGLASLEGDDDGDGVANLLEYYTGADPLDPADRGFSDMQGFHLGEEGLRVSYRQAIGREDVTARLQESDDLLEWFDTRSDYLSVEPASGGYAWTFRLPAEELGQHPQRYFRLSVTPATDANSGGTLPPPL